MNPQKYRKAFTIVEIILVLAAFPILSTTAKAIGFRPWEVRHLGFRYVSDTMIYVLIPVLALTLSRRNFRDYGFVADGLGYHLRIGVKAAVILGLICSLFPVMAFFGTAHYKWSGSIALTTALFLGTGALVVWFKQDPSDPTSSVGRLGLMKFVAFLAISFLVGYTLLPVSKTLAKILYCFVFVGFLQEILFRGYVQSRLNDVFGKPFSAAGVSFGPGLIIASLLFGHFHLLNSGAEYPWAIWTTAAGLFFGIIREKTGSVVSSGFAHGLMVIPAALLAGS